MFDDMFDEESDMEVEALDDEYEDYLAQPPETKKSCPDPMRWLYDHRERYPRLSLMALDYLSIPGMYCSSFRSLSGY